MSDKLWMMETKGGRETEQKGEREEIKADWHWSKTENNNVHKPRFLSQLPFQRRPTIPAEINVTN